jgi:hypothetical protein
MTDMELAGWHTYFKIQADTEKEAYEKAKRRR